MPPEQFSPEQGFRLRVTGRIERLPGGKAVQCIQPAGIEQQPICLAAVSFDAIRLENPMNGETLAIWSMHRVPRPSPSLAARKRVVCGKSGSGRGDSGGPRI